MTTRRSFWSRPRGPLLLGAVACAACCATPIAALVVGAGAASTLAAIAEPIAGILVATAAILSIAIFVRRRRTRSVAACAIDGSCGCGPSTKRTLYSSPEPIAEAPIACTADLGDKETVQFGIDEYRRAFDHLVSTDRTSDGFRWRFRSAPGLESRLQKLARAEHACCSFMKFDVSSTGDEIIWQTRTDMSPEAQRALDEYMHLPERLREEPRRGRDVAHLKAGATRAGIVFTSDAAG